MMLRFGTAPSQQHLQKNSGQAVQDVWCVWKWLPDGRDQVSAWRQRKESGCFCKLIPAATKQSLREEEVSHSISSSFWVFNFFIHASSSFYLNFSSAPMFLYNGVKAKLITKCWEIYQNQIKIRFNELLNSKKIVRFTIYKAADVANLFFYTFMYSSLIHHYQ